MDTPSPQQIEKWKSEHHEVFLIEVPNPEGGSYRGYFHKPTRSVLSNASRFVNKEPFKASEIIFNGCVIECDPDMKDKIEVFLSASEKLGELMHIREAEIKKL